MLEFIGHFHPLVVHLPIGILSLALFMEVLLLWKKDTFVSVSASLDLIWLSGAISGAVSCVCGYLLSLSDSYDAEILSRHQWLGVLLTLLALGIWFLRLKIEKESAFQTNLYRNLYRGLWILTAFVLFGAGHLGGTLTHGEGYLSKPFWAMFGVSDGVKRQPIANIEEAKVYDDVIAPVFESKCYSCHSAKKQKGDLRLDSPSYILQGGETGEILVKGNADESDLITRIHADLNDEDRMPPKGKPQLTNQETTLLHWWVQQGAPFDQQIKQLQKTPEATKALSAFQKGDSSRDIWANADVPTTKAPSPNAQAVQKLRAQGILVLPVSNGSTFLHLNFVNATHLTDQDLQKLKPDFEALAANIVWIKLNQSKITDASLSLFVLLPHLTRLSLMGTKITDVGMNQIQKIASLRSLNLMQTHVTDQGFSKLSSIKSLKKVYVYQSKITAQGAESLKQRLPNCQIDLGDYDLPSLVTDTLVHREQKKK